MALPLESTREAVTGFWSASQHPRFLNVRVARLAQIGRCEQLIKTRSETSSK
jgi:hypothetical protein